MPEGTTTRLLPERKEPEESGYGGGLLVVILILRQEFRKETRGNEVFSVSLEKNGLAKTSSSGTSESVEIVAFLFGSCTSGITKAVEKGVSFGRGGN